MSSSDSEHFESADEGDSEEKSHKKVTKESETTGTGTALESDELPTHDQEKTKSTNVTEKTESQSPGILETDKAAGMKQENNILPQLNGITSETPSTPKPAKERDSEEKMPKENLPVHNCDQINTHTIEKTESEVQRTLIEETSYEEAPPTRPRKSGPMKLGVRLPKQPKPIVPKAKPKDEDDHIEVCAPFKPMVNQSGSDFFPEPKESKRIAPKFETSDASGGWGGKLGGWSSSLFSSASQITSHLTHGITKVVETVETGIGIPEPEVLAREHNEEVEKLIAEAGQGDSTKKEEEKSSFRLGGFMSGMAQQFSRVVEDTGSKVISGSLDTLELIGKKTMDVLQEGDPGLKKKRSIIKKIGPNLSEVLREAKEKAEEDCKLQEEEFIKPNFGQFFDEYHGLVHLEALEMLSSRCDTQLQSLLLTLNGDKLRDMQNTIVEIKVLCQLNDVDDDNSNKEQNFVQIIEESATEINELELAKSFVLIYEEIKSNLSTIPDLDLPEMELTAIKSLAAITSSCINHFHRVGELLLVQESQCSKIWAKAITSLTNGVCFEINILSSQFAEEIQKHSEEGPQLENSLANVFLEASNGCTYVEDAFQLLIPILQWFHISH